MSKEQILNYLKKYKYYVIGIIIIILIIVFFLFITSTEVQDISLNNEEEYIEENEIIPDKIVVDVKGAVINPGVYILDTDSIVNDAIKVSGGLNTDADTSTINLSKKLSDEMVIIIYTTGEINEMKNGTTSVKYIDKECICPKITNNACIEKKITNDPDSSSNSNSSTNTKVNINTANKEELMDLNGIGESKAKAIIEYRNTNGSFKSIEEITNISGIGNAVYEKIKDNITI